MLLSAPRRAATAVLVLAAGPWAALGAQAPPRVGQVPDRPGTLRESHRTYGLLVERPRARVSSPGVLEVALRTRTPTVAGSLYAGLTTLDEDLDWPRYRMSVRAQPADPAREHVLRYEFRPLLARMPTTPFEARISWRVELYVPAFGAARWIEGSTWFDRDGLGPAPSFVAGPFLDRVRPDGAVVSCELDVEEAVTVHVGDRVFTSPKALRHEVRIDGLAPDSDYQYRVLAGASASRPYPFRTSGPGAFRFACMVDSREGVGGGARNALGTNGEALRALSTLAYRKRARFVVFAGDLINGYTDSVVDFRLQLDAFRRALQPVAARIPVYESMGNHETVFDVFAREGGGSVMLDKRGQDSAEAIFADVFVNPSNGPGDEGPGTPPYAENVYWFDWGCARFLMLNNNYWWSNDPHRVGGNLEGYVLPRQMAWVREQVARADADESVAVVFVAAQEPAFPNGGHSQDAMWWRGGDTDGNGRVDAADIDIVGNRNELWEILTSSPKTVAYLTGDEHAYSRLLVRPQTPVGHKRKPDGSQASFARPLWQITTGGAGAPWYDRETHLPWSDELAVHSTQAHVALFEVAADGSSVQLWVWSETGQLLDEVRLR